MKRFWHTFLAVVATAAMTHTANTANAQWNPSGEIGSYQSILSRAGYNGGSTGAGVNQTPIQTSPGAAVAYAGNQGNCGGSCGGNCNGNCGGGATYGGGGAYGGGGSYGGSYGGPAYGGGSMGYSGGAMGFGGGSMNYGTSGGGYSQQGAVGGGMVGGGAMNGGMVNGGMVNGGVINGGMVNGGMVNGGMVNGGAINGGIVNGGAMNGGMVGGGVINSGIVQGGMVGGYAGDISGGSVVDRGYVGAPMTSGIGQVYSSAPVYAAPTYQIEPVYVAGQSFAPQPQRRPSNLVVGVFGINMRRDYEDDRRLGYGAADFFTTDLDHGNMNGLGASISSRKSNGRGWEALYWGLDEETDIEIAGPTYTYLTGLADLQHVPAGASVQAVFDAGDAGARIYRNTEIQNLEFNLLQNGGTYCTRGGRNGNYEMLAGVRLFNFEEDLRYVSNSTQAGYPTTTEYTSETENLLTGFQLGARNEICLSNRFRLSKGLNVGMFNNRINTRQRIFDETGYNPLIYTGPNVNTPYDLSDTKNDVAFLGQFELGLIYQISQKSRARFGYRAMGVSGVALAGDQIPYDFTNVNRIQNANSNGSLLLHGFYYGAEFCF